MTNMGIDVNKIKDDLRTRLIDLIDSERGLASRLAKSVGKTGSYFSELKRGCPVNALHIIAVGNVLGRDQVCDLLGIPINSYAISMNEDLVFLEQNNPEAFEKAKAYIKGLKDGTAAKRQ